MNMQKEKRVFERRKKRRKDLKQWMNLMKFSIMIFENKQIKFIFTLNHFPRAFFIFGLA